MTLKDLIAFKEYGKNWSECTTKEKGKLILKHREQFQFIRDRRKTMGNERLLGEIQSDVKYIRETIDKHLEHHAKFYLLMGGTLLTSIIAIVLSVFK